MSASPAAEAFTMGILAWLSLAHTQPNMPYSLFYHSYAPDLLYNISKKNKEWNKPNYFQAVLFRDNTD